MESHGAAQRRCAAGWLPCPRTSQWNGRDQSFAPVCHFSTIPQCPAKDAPGVPGPRAEANLSYAVAITQRLFGLSHTLLQCFSDKLDERCQS